MSQRAVPAGGYHRKSLDNSWRTPEWLLDCVRTYFGGQIPLDAASSAGNPTRAAVYLVPPAGPMFAEFDPGHQARERADRQLTLIEPSEGELVGEQILADGLVEDWPGDAAWVNPPYGSHLLTWLERIAVMGAGEGRDVVALIPTSRWEVARFQAAWSRADLVTFVRKRIAFVSAIDGAAVKGNTSGSMLLGFNAREGAWIEAFGHLGLTIRPTPVTP